MSSVTFPPELGGDGSTVSDDANTDTGLREGGYMTRFVPALQQFVALCQSALTNAQAAAASALSALNSASTNATSTASLSLADSGDLTVPLQQSGKAFTAGMTVGIARTSDPVKQMIGVIKTFTPGVDPTKDSMVVTMQSKTATAGPFTDWTVFRTASGGVPVTRKYTGAGLVAVSGDGSLAADRTITVTEASATEIATADAADVVITPAAWAASGVRQTLGYAASIAWAMTRRKAKVTLTGNGAMQAPTGMVEGGEYSLAIIQDATGGRTLSWASCYDFGLDGVPTLSTGAGKRDMVYLECFDATTPVFICTFKPAA